MAWRNLSAFGAWLVAGSMIVGVAGCGGGGGGEEKKAPEAPPIPTVGANGGKIFELGAKEYYVEVVHAKTSVEEKEKLTLVSYYLLDSTAKKPAPIASLDIVVNTKADGKTTEHKVNSQPLSGEIGKSSRFIATDPKDVAAIGAPGAEVEVVAMFGDKKLTGTYKNEPAPAATATGTPSGTAAAPTPPAPTTTPTPSATAAPSAK